MVLGRSASQNQPQIPEWGIFGAWVCSKLSHSLNPDHGGLQDTPPQHFLSLLGDYGGDKGPYKCGPIGNGSFRIDANHELILQPGARIKPGSEEASLLLGGGWRNKAAHEVRVSGCFAVRAPSVENRELSDLEGT